MNSEHITIITTLVIMIACGIGWASAIVSCNRAEKALLAANKEISRVSDLWNNTRVAGNELLEANQRLRAAMHKATEEIRRIKSDAETAKQLSSVFEDFKNLMNMSLGVVVGINVRQQHVAWERWEALFDQGKLDSMLHWLKTSQDIQPGLMRGYLLRHCTHRRVTVTEPDGGICNACGKLLGFENGNWTTSPRRSQSASQQKAGSQLPDTKAMMASPVPPQTAPTPESQE